MTERRVNGVVVERSVSAGSGAALEGGRIRRAGMQQLAETPGSFRGFEGSMFR